MITLALLTRIILAAALSWQAGAPQTTDALRRAQMLFNQRRFAEAAAAARQAREQQPDLLQAWKLSGLSLQLVGRVDEAAQEFSLALQRFPTDADLWFFL